jgi:hypothetical protein
MKFFTVTEKANIGISPSDLRVALDTPLQKLAEREDALLLTGDLFQQRGDLRVINEKHPGDKVALVFVATAPGEGGEIFLTANAQEEFLLSQYRVGRRVMSLEHALGVFVIQSDEFGTLLKLLPGSSFRIQRSGELEGAPEELIVIWTGRYNPNDPTGGLRVFGKTQQQRREEPDALEVA